MDIYAPHYYGDFRCIADKCRDICCIGWEIDIDPVTMETYQAMEGEMGEEIRRSLTTSEDGCSCFKLTEDERCPFLNEKGLCRLILHGGDEMLCEICRMHPRFVNMMPEYTEMGIGLCCEAAADIILSDGQPFTLVKIGEDDEEAFEGSDEAAFVTAARKIILEKLENEESVAEKSGRLLETGRALDGLLDDGEFDAVPSVSGRHTPAEFFRENKGLILTLEPLNAQWEDISGRIGAMTVAPASYDEEERLAAQNLLKYFVYRYFNETLLDYSAFKRLALAVFSADAVEYIMAVSGMSYKDAAVLWSKEIEYSAANLDRITEAMASRK